MFRKITILVFFILLYTLVQAQTKPQNTTIGNIQGIVYELTEEDKEAFIVDATVRLLNPSDSMVVATTSSNKQGHFLFSSVKPSNYILSVAYLGYTTIFKKISEDQFKEKQVDLGKIQIDISSLELPEVSVTGKVPDIVVKEDTVEYNASAYKLGQNAVAEDLLKRLLGAEVDVNGTIKIAGKEVKQVLVDGKEFFGKDVTMATKNIQTNIIDKVQVIDKKTDTAIKTGVDEGEKETIINLAIKPGMNKGWIGNAGVGAGALIDNPTNEPARYSGNLMLSRFVDGDNISLTFNSNNVNNSFFSDGGSFSSGGGFGGVMMLMGPSSSGRGGISTSSSAGLNISKSQKDKFKVGGSVSYGYTDQDSKNKSFRQNILIDSVSYREAISSNKSYSNRLSINGYVDYQLDTLNSISIQTTLTYRDANSHNKSYQSTLAGDADSTRVNQSESSTINQTGSWNLSATATYSRKFTKKGRQFSVVAGTNINNSNNDGTNRSLSEFFLQPERNLYLDQEIENNTSSNSFNFRISHVEPVWTEKNTIQMFYSIDNNQTTNIKETYDYDPATETYSILNPNYSKSLDNNFINQRAGIAFNSNQSKYSYNIGFNIIPSYTKSKTFIKNGNSEGNDSILNNIDGRDVMNYSPQSRFTYRFNKTTSMSFNYTGNTRQPSVEQLDPTVNNTNPLSIRSGNPYLLPSFTNSFRLNFNNYKQEQQQYLNASLNFSFTQNEIIYFTDYEGSTGIQYSKPINENGSWNSSANIMYGRPLDKKKRLKINNNVNFNYSNRIGYMMVNQHSERNVSGTMNIGEYLSLSFNKDKFYGQISGNINYSKTSNSLENQKGRESTNFGLSYNNTISLPKDWSFSTDISYRGNRGLSAGYNTDEVMWNMEISKQFLKKKQASIRLKWNDILQETASITRNVSASYIEDIEYNALSSYFLVSFSYRINQMGGGKKTTTLIRQQ